MDLTKIDMLTIESFMIIYWIYRYDGNFKNIFVGHAPPDGIQSSNLSSFPIQSLNLDTFGIIGVTAYD